MFGSRGASLGCLKVDWRLIVDCSLDCKILSISIISSYCSLVFIATYAFRFLLSTARFFSASSNTSFIPDSTLALIFPDLRFDSKDSTKFSPKDTNFLDSHVISRSNSSGVGVRLFLCKVTLASLS